MLRCKMIQGDAFDENIRARMCLRLGKAHLMKEYSHASLHEEHNAFSSKNVVLISSKSK